MKTLWGKILLLIIALGVVLLIGAGKYLYTKTTISPTELQVNQTETPALTTERSLADTSGWKMYADKNLGITFKYPPDWPEPTLFNNPKTSSLITVPFPYKNPPDITFNVDVENLPTDNTIGTLAEKEYSSIQGSPKFNTDLKKEVMMIDSHEAISVTHIFRPIYASVPERPAPPRQEGKIFIAGSNNRTITISYNYLIQNNKDQQSIIHTVISSFKLDDSAFQVAVDVPLLELIIGAWDTAPGAAGYGAVYQFFSSGKYNYRKSQFDGLNRDVGHSGYWKLDGGKLLLTKIRTYSIVGGTIGECVSGVCIEGGSLTTNTASSTRSVDIQQCLNDALSKNRVCLSIGGTQFYLSGGPTIKSEGVLYNEPTF